jgi:glycogen(starch) synthase
MNPNAKAYIEGELLLLRVAAEFCPDLLHSNQFCFGRMPLPIPRLLTAHSDVLSWGAACLPCGLEPSDWLTEYCSMVEQGLAAADGVVAPSRWMLDTLRENFTLPTRTRVILNGRSLPEVRVSEVRVLQAISAGRLWDKAKKLTMLADVHTAIPIVVAGERAHQGAEAPKSIGDTVQVGPLSESDLLALFRASSIYLATSIYEPFGLAPLEAALCGCAVVANDIPSLREVWGDAALYFDNADTLSSLLEQLQVSPKILLTARQRSGRRALQLSAAHLTAEYLALYAELLSSKKLRASATEELATYGS